jgi:hypothetical protein
MNSGAYSGPLASVSHSCQQYTSDMENPANSMAPFAAASIVNTDSYAISVVQLAYSVRKQ